MESLRGIWLRLWRSHDPKRDAYWAGWDAGCKYALARIETEIFNTYDQGRDQGRITGITP